MFCFDGNDRQFLDRFLGGPVFALLLFVFTQRDPSDHFKNLIIWRECLIEIVSKMFRADEHFRIEGSSRASIPEQSQEVASGSDRLGTRGTNDDFAWFFSDSFEFGCIAPLGHSLLGASSLLFLLDS